MGWLIAAPVVGLAVLLALTPIIDARRQKILRRCLRDVCDILNREGVDYWCDYGTLLGYYRDGDVIRTDYDIDLCLPLSEKPTVIGLRQAFKDRGYTLADTNGTTKLVVRITDDRTWYYVDMYTYVSDGAMLRSTFRPVEDIPAALVADRVLTSFLETAIRVPQDIEPLLLHRYGPGFRTPRRADVGLAYGYSSIEMFKRLIENNCLGIWSMLRTMVMGPPQPRGR